MREDDSGGTRIAELEADNRRLRRLLEQQDAPRELRHRLRRTIALLRAIIRRSAATPRSLESHTHHIEGRLDSIARAQAEADERGGSDLHKLIADELLQYDAAEGDRLTLSGPKLCLQPRAGQIFALAIHELAVNAVEHGALGADGDIEVIWDVAEQDDAPSLTFVWRESFGRISPPATHEGLGTEVLTKMLTYELDATADLTLDAKSLVWTTTLPFTSSVGLLGSSRS